MMEAQRVEQKHLEDKRLQELFDILTQLTSVKDLSLKNYRELSKILTKISLRLSTVREQLTAINNNLVVVNDIIDNSALGWLLQNLTKSRQEQLGTVLSIIKYSTYVLVAIASLLVIVAQLLGSDQEILKDVIGLFESMVG